MPTYEYRCKTCSHEFEAYQSFSDDALTECPECGGPLRKLFGNVGISFKGSGFYKTDHGSRSSSASGDSGAKSDSGTKADTPAKADAAPKSDSSSSTSGSTSGSSSSGTKSESAA
jgi:putative FmdB family regulatory protein